MNIGTGYFKFKGMHETCGDPNKVYIKLDDRIFLFEEDPSDGYRSYCQMEEITAKDVSSDINFNFEDCPVPCYVDSVTDNDFCGIFIYTDDSKKILLAELGTLDYNDYYPMCRMIMDIPAINSHLADHHLIGET